jgi:hypothetical protein
MTIATENISSAAGSFGVRRRQAFRLHGLLLSNASVDFVCPPSLARSSRANQPSVARSIFDELSRAAGTKKDQTSRAGRAGGLFVYRSRGGEKLPGDPKSRCQGKVGHFSFLGLAAGDIVGLVGDPAEPVSRASRGMRQVGCPSYCAWLGIGARGLFAAFLGSAGRNRPPTIPLCTAAESPLATIRALSFSASKDKGWAILSRSYLLATKPPLPSCSAALRAKLS